jgi:hypothetical protein
VERLGCVENVIECFLVNLESSSEDGDVLGSGGKV